MKTTINNHIQEILKSNEYMILYNSDNKMLINYLKDLREKVIYLQNSVNYEQRYNLSAINDFVEEIIKVDPELTHIDISIQLKELYNEKKVAKVTAKLF